MRETQASHAPGILGILYAFFSSSVHLKANAILIAKQLSEVCAR